MPAPATLRTCVLAALFGFLGALAASLLPDASVLSAQEGVVTAQEFRVVDASNNVRGVLSTKTANGWVQLELRGPDGRPRIDLNVNQEGGAFVLMFDKSNPGSYKTDFLMPSISLVGPDGTITRRLQ